MRYIDKSQRCVEFENLIARNRPSSWNNRKFSQSDVKLSLHRHLLAEQQYLCIYCQQSVPDKTQKDDQLTNPPVRHPSHIEHIKPREIFINLIFEHTNLAVSCEGYDVELAERGAPEFCGHPSKSKFDDTLHLHPFEQVDIEDFFEYDILGGIKASPKDPEKAHYMIELFQLNHEKLRDMRLRQRLLVVQKVNHGLDIEAYLDPTQPELPKFFSMLRQLFGMS